MSINEIEDFKQGKNCIKISNPLELRKFRTMLYNQNMHSAYKWMIKYAPDWPDLIKLGHTKNEQNPYLFLFEFTPNNGLSWTDNEEKAKQTFKKEPIEF